MPLQLPPSIKSKIIDSHLHFWDLAEGKHPWLLRPSSDSFLGEYSALKKNYLPENYLADSEGWEVEKVVAVQAGWQRGDVLAEPRWLSDINTGLIGAVVAYANLASIDIAHQLEALATIALVRGIRQIVAWHPDPILNAVEENYLLQASWQKNFKLLAKHGYSFDLQIYPDQVDEAYLFLKNNVDIPVVIEHALQPLACDHEYLSSWERKIKKLAQLPQVYIKISGLNLFFRPDLATIRRLFETMVEHFSPTRCMVGSNFPVEKLFIGFGDWWTDCATIAAQYTEAEQENLFSQTAKSFYALDVSF